MCQNKGKQGPTDAWNMMDHRVAQAPMYPATVAVAYTERTQERDVNAILLSEAFGRCLQELGQYAQSGYMINADCYLNQRDSYVCFEEHHSLLNFFFRGYRATALPPHKPSSSQRSAYGIPSLKCIKSSSILAGRFAHRRCSSAISLKISLLSSLFPVVLTSKEQSSSGEISKAVFPPRS